MEECFVIQPFDGGVFDRRYDDIFVPAVKEAGFQPYRTDRDPGVSIPIDEIERKIRDSIACLADITTDNPNVWFELGYAIASQKPVCIVCSKERTTKFPFDVQHRSIIHYEVGSRSDFDKLGARIEERLRAILAKERQIVRVASLPTAVKTAGLPSHEVAALTIIMSSQYTNPPGPSAHRIQQDMEQAGYTPIAMSLALTGLLARKLIIGVETVDEYQREKYTAYTLTPAGQEFLLANIGAVNLRKEPVREKRVNEADIPF